MAEHPLVPLDYEVPYVVVFSAAELGSKDELVDAGNRRSEHTCVIVVGGALVHHHLVEDDWVVLDISQVALIGSEKKNSTPWDTDSCLNQMFQMHFYPCVHMHTQQVHKFTRNTIIDSYIITYVLSLSFSLSNTHIHIHTLYLPCCLAAV